jgi:hypothetical protein
MVKDFESQQLEERSAALREKREKTERRECIISAAARWITIASGAAAAGVALAFLTAFLSATAHADTLKTGVWAGSSTNGSSWSGSSLSLEHDQLGVQILTQAGDLPRASGGGAGGALGLLKPGSAPPAHVATSVAGLSWRLPMTDMGWGIDGGPSVADLTIQPAITNSGNRALGGLGWNARLHLTPGFYLFTRRAAWRIRGASAPISTGMTIARFAPDGGVISVTAMRVQGAGSAVRSRRGYAATASWTSRNDAWHATLGVQETHGGDALPLAVQPASPADVVGGTYAAHALTCSVSHQFNSQFSASLSVAKLHNSASGGASIAYHF